jgi:predicted Zn finger-like uncharacterized protein
VSLIIECPACETRYKLNKPIPEGGRPVKCARCAHQWRLLPEHALEDADEEAAEHQEQATAAPVQPTAEQHEVFAGVPAAQAADPGDDDPDQDQQTRWDAPSRHDEDEHAGPPAAEDSEPSWASRFSPGFGASGFSRVTPAVSQAPSVSEDEGWRGDDDIAPESEPRPEDDLPRLQGWQSGREPFNSSISALSDSTLPDYGAPEHRDDEAGTSRDLDWAREAKDRWTDDQWSDPSDSDDQVEGLGGPEAPFPSASEPEVEEAPAANEGGGSWASRLMRLRQSAFGKRSRPEPEEDAEAEIRHALNSALEQPGEGSAGKSPFQKLSPARFGGPAGEDAASEKEESFLRFSDHLDRLEEDGRGGRAERFSFGSLRDDIAIDEENEEEAPFRPSGQHARTPIFGAKDLDEEKAVSPGAAETYGVDQFESELQSVFGAVRDQGAADPDGDEDGRTAYIETREDFGRVYGDRFDDGEVEVDPHLALTEDLAALRSELESTDIANYERDHPVQSGGGLAVVAAWAVFVSVISGVMLALISFRNDIMTALPGTADLYQTLGFEVVQSGVDFADVSYRWRTADGKPMIEVTGQVVNMTGRTITVPRVLVNVRDAGGGDAVQATANVPTQELAPHQRASFSLEFLSPPADVAQIELEFDRNR